MGSCTKSCRPYFYPRSPCGERHPAWCLPASVRYFYPRSPCGERRDVIAVMTEAQSISIHALLAESDGSNMLEGTKPGVFLSTLSLRRATGGIPCDVPVVQFLSTLSLRRATFQCSHGAAPLHISIHALLAESDLKQFVVGDVMGISIHALLAESDGCDIVSIERCSLFLSTLSLRRATELDPMANKTPFISIHALLAESDAVALFVYRRSPIFLSTLSLRRATRPNGQKHINSRAFLSTLSLRRATLEQSSSYSAYLISIHALLAESDQ